MTPPFRIAVVGAGAAGLATLRELRDAGHEITVFERSEVPGGHWNVDYDALHLITPKSTTLFRDYPQPAEYPPYPSREQTANYLHAFARDQDLLRNIRFNTKVARLAPAGRAGVDGWNVELGDGSHQHFDGVVVANGHLHHPYIPELPGDFAGKLLHSADYRNVEDIDGTRVLVVGAGNSGCDLAVDAAQARLTVDISVRHGFLFMPKSLLGVPRAELPINKLPFRLYGLALRALVRVSVGRPEQYPGLPKPATRDFTKQRSIVNDLLPYWIQHGRVKVRPTITSVRHNTVTFDDGTSADYDTILLATGFRYHAPFLADDVMPRENDMPRRWASAILPDGLANLYLVGLVAPMGAQWPIYELQARQVDQMLHIQATMHRPLVEEFQRRDPGFGDLELQRPNYVRMYTQTQKTLDQLSAPAKETAR